MADQDAPLSAVLNNPDDDAPRVAYADWCARQDDAPNQARAEFIRLQIEMAHMDRAAVNRGEAYHQRHRESELTREYGARWAGLVAGMVTSYEFDRGFVELLALRARNWLDRAALLHGMAPIRHLNLTRARDAAQELLSSPSLGLIRSLSLDSCGLTDDHIAMLAGSPAVTELRWLSIADNQVSMRGAEAMAASPYLKKLAFAQFIGNYVDPCEQGGDDSGIIVATWFPPEGEQLESRYGFLPWLHRDGATRDDFYPDRFRL